MFYDVIHFTLVFMSRLVLGQYLLTVFDFYLNKMEKTLDYCIPTHHVDMNRYTPEERPMSWLLFIPALILLRIWRFHLSVVSIAMGKGEVTSQDMKKRVVDFRRYYRSIRHYAIQQPSSEQQMLIAKRRSANAAWRFYYDAYEMIFMTKPLPGHFNHAIGQVQEVKDEHCAYTQRRH